MKSIAVQLLLSGTLVTISDENPSAKYIGRDEAAFTENGHISLGYQSWVVVTSFPVRDIGKWF